MNPSSLYQRTKKMCRDFLASLFFFDVTSVLFHTQQIRRYTAKFRILQILELLEIRYIQKLKVPTGRVSPRQSRQLIQAVQSVESANNLFI
jgi:hypothetical protein